MQLKNSFKTIILVSSVLEIPIELEKEITVLNFPLPTREDLAALLDKIVEDVSQLKQVKIELEDTGSERLLQAALGLTLGEAENVFAKIIVKDGRLSGDDAIAIERVGGGRGFARTRLARPPRDGRAPRPISPRSAG